MPACAANQRTCAEPVVIDQPVPLCRNHGIETSLAILPLALGTALNHAEPRTRAPRRTREPMQTIRLRRSERTAIDGLAASRTPITWRNVAAAIRTAGGSCSSQRAAEIARHFRAPSK